jgi:(p)ppGpp synthase/HD superfamily hydrolase
MTNEKMWRLNEIFLAPYMQLATALIGKSREGGGNMFRHQIDTMGILIDYGYIEPVLLKASIVHDIIEDVPDFNRNQLLSVDYDSPSVYELVLEVTRNEGENKADFLTRILDRGSRNARLLKSADRISNMISLGFVNNTEFVARYTEETADYVVPIAESVDSNMLFELNCLVESRRDAIKTGAIPKCRRCPIVRSRPADISKARNHLNIQNT